MKEKTFAVTYQDTDTPNATANGSKDFFCAEAELLLIERKKTIKMLAERSIRVYSYSYEKDTEHT